MKIDFEKTSELKNLLKVGTEHTVGYQGSTRKQGIVADSIMVAEETLYSKAANNNVEEVFAVEEIKEKDPIDNISVNSNKDNDSKPSGIGCEKDDDELSTKSESSTYEKVITMHDYIDCDQNNNTTKDEEWCDVDVLRKEKKTKAVTVSSEDVTLIGKLEVHPGLYDDSPRKKYATPLPVGCILSLKDCSKYHTEVLDLNEEFGFEFAAAVGSLMYLSNTYVKGMYAIRMGHTATNVHLTSKMLR